MWKPFDRDPDDDDEVEEEPALPELEPGMFLEVLTNQNRLLFRGRIMDVNERDDSIRIEDAEGSTLPYIEYNSRIKLRGFSGSEAICLVGMIGGSTKTFWKVDRLGTLQTSERRDYFRQNISLEVCLLRVDDLPENQPEAQESAETGVTNTGAHSPAVRPEKVHADSTATTSHDDPEGEPKYCTATCRMLDISAGGCMLFTKSVLRVGEHVELRNITLLPGEATFDFKGVIRRAIKREDIWEYGCEFQDQDGKQQERLIRLILLLQRNELRARRGIL